MDIADGGREALDALSVTTVLQTKRGSFQVEQGMEVVGSDGERVGVLHDVRPALADILVHRPLLQRDVYIPFDAVDRVRDGALVLTIPAAEGRARAGRTRPCWPFPTPRGGPAGGTGGPTTPLSDARQAGV
jgi:sporulation protein YlmC with PRC-barrel domain